MIDLEKLRARASGIPDSDGAIGPTWCTPTEVLELLDHIAQLEKDAWRYRWMRSKATGDATLWESVMDGEGLYSMKCEDELDQAIDTAMESKHG